MNVPSSNTTFRFGPFLLDCADARLYQHDRPLTLTPKAFAVLTQLVQAQGSLVSKDNLFDTVWAGTVVTEAALTVCIREVRQVLGDSARAPQFIETVHKRGYRFVAPVETAAADSPASATVKFGGNFTSEALVRRDALTAPLMDALTHSRNNEKQTVFVTGEAGLGKTTLAEFCLQQFSQQADVRIVRGQCVEHHGRVEPYLPWLDAMTRLCLNDTEALAIFRRCAPMWLLQMPALLDVSEREELERRLAGTPPERMLREILEALSALAAQCPLVICLDDMHFCDSASVELLAGLARRQDAGRLLLIACYRPVHLIVNKHPLKALKQELEVRGQCIEIALPLFSPGEVGDYIAARLPRRSLPGALGEAIHARTDGNPLFTLNVLEYLIKQAYLQEVDSVWRLTCELETVKNCVPNSLIEMLGYHIEQLDEETQAILQVAAVASDVGTGNVQFSAEEVAVALQQAPDLVEDRCDQLARHGHFLRPAETGQWPDGTQLTRYAFTHSLYQKAFYRRLSQSKRTTSHLRIGERLALAFGPRHTDIATTLAVHFEQGRDYHRAATYLQLSSDTAARRGVNRNAKKSLEHALRLAGRLPAGPEQRRLLVQLHTALATVLIAGQGNTMPEVEQNYRRARELCDAPDGAAQLFPIVFGLRSCSLLAGRLEEAHGLGNELLSLAENVADTDLSTEARVALASTAFFLGEFKASLAHATAGFESYREDRHAYHVTHYGLDPAVFCRCRTAQSLWSLGYPEQALQSVQEALQLAQQLEHPYSLAFALNNLAWVHMFRREAPAAELSALQAVQLADDHGFPFHAGWGQVMQGWAVAAQGNGAAGVALAQTGLAAPLPTASAVRSYLLTVLAETHLQRRDYAAGLAALDEISVGAERFLEAERYRLRGELLLLELSSTAADKKQQADKVVGNCLRKALECARRQQARSLELRAAVSLAHYLSQRGRADQAQQLLAPILDWFTEGHELLDLSEASALLKSLGNGSKTVKVLDMRT